jgi:hypothetical protein
MLAMGERLGRIVGSDKLIRVAVDAILAELETPALVELAGLTRREEHEAHRLFDHVIDELGIAPRLSADPVAARWELVRWWCQMIAVCQLSAEVGASSGSGPGATSAGGRENGAAGEAGDVGVGTSVTPDAEMPLTRGRVPPERRPATRRARRRLLWRDGDRSERVSPRQPVDRLHACGCDPEA